VRERVETALPERKGEKRAQRQARVKLICDGTMDGLKKQEEANANGAVRFLVDEDVSHPYRRFQESNTPLNQILVRLGDGSLHDIADLSPVIARAEPLTLCRAYVFRDDTDAGAAIDNIISTRIREGDDAKS
jgi:hypothetical protein